MIKLRILFCLSKACTTEPHSVRWHFIIKHMRFIFTFLFWCCRSKYLLEQQMHISPQVSRCNNHSLESNNDDRTPGVQVNAAYQLRENGSRAWTSTQKVQVPVKCNNLFNLNHIRGIITTALSTATYHWSLRREVYTFYLGGLNAISGQSKLQQKEKRSPLNIDVSVVELLPASTRIQRKNRKLWLFSPERHRGQNNAMQVLL